MFLHDYIILMAYLGISHQVLLILDGSKDKCV